MALTPQQEDWLTRHVLGAPAEFPAASAEGAMARQVGDNEKERAAKMRTEAQKLRAEAALDNDVNKIALAQEKEAKAAELEHVYDDEDKRLAFRTDDPNRKDQDHVVTRYYSDDEREANTLRPNADGQMVDPDGNIVDGNRLYAMDAETGELVIADDQPHSRLEHVDPNTGVVTPLAENRNGIYDNNKKKMVAWPVDANGDKVEPDALPPHLSPESADAVLAGRNQGVRNTRMHHSTMLGGKIAEGHAGAAGAGDVTMKDGKVTKVTNVSGHYKPEFKHLLQTVEALVAQGAMLNTELVDQHGQPLDAKTATLHKKTATAFNKIGAQIKTLLGKRDALVDNDDDDDDDSDDDSARQRDAIDKEIKALADKAQKVEQARAVLRDIGAGPRNAIAGDVEYNDFEGADVRSRGGAKTNMTAEELLSGKDGGGSKVGYRDTKGRDALMQSIRAKGETCAAAETKDGEARAPMENWDGKRDTALKDVTDMGFADDPRPVSKGAASGADADNAYSAPPVGGAGGDANNAYTAPPIQGDAGDTNNAYTAPPIQGDAGDAGNAYTAPPIQGDAGDAGNAYTAPPIQGDAGDAGNAYTAPPIQGDAGDAGNAYTAPPVSGDNGPVYSAPPLGNDDYDDDSSEYDEAPPEPNASDNAEYGAVPGHMRDAQDGAAQAPPEYDGYGAVPQVEEATGVDGNNEDADISAQETYGVVPGAKDRKEANRDQP